MSTDRTIELSVRADEVRVGDVHQILGEIRVSTASFSGGRRWLSGAHGELYVDPDTRLVVSRLDPEAGLIDLLADEYGWARDNIRHIVTAVRQWDADHQTAPAPAVDPHASAGEDVGAADPAGIGAHRDEALKDGLSVGGAFLHGCSQGRAYGLTEALDAIAQARNRASDADAHPLLLAGLDDAREVVYALNRGDRPMTTKRTYLVEMPITADAPTLTYIGDDEFTPKWVEWSVRGGRLSVVSFADPEHADFRNHTLDWQGKGVPGWVPLPKESDRRLLYALSGAWPGAWGPRP